MVTTRGNGRTGASGDAVTCFPCTQTWCGAGSRPRTQPAQPALLPLTGRDLQKDGIPIEHIRLPLNPRPRFATYWCPPQPRARLGAGSPGALEPSGVWARASSSLGMGLVFLALLSLQVKKPTQGGGFKKMHQQQKKTRSDKCQPEGRRQKIKEIGSWGEKDLTNRAIH